MNKQTISVLTEVLEIAKAHPEIEIFFKCKNHDSGFDTTFQTPVSCCIEEAYDTGCELLLGEELILNHIYYLESCDINITHYVEEYPDLDAAKAAGYEISEVLIVRMG